MTTLGNFSVRQGDTITRVLTITEDGAGVDLTGATVRFNLKAFGASALAIDPAPTLALTDAENGVVTLTLTAAQTAALTARQTYRSEVEITDALSNVTTPIEGLVHVREDVG